MWSEGRRRQMESGRKWNGNGEEDGDWKVDGGGKGRINIEILWEEDGGVDGDADWEGDGGMEG